LQNREGGDRSRSGGGGDFQRSDSSPGSRPSSVLPDLLTSSPGQRQDKSTSEEVRSTRPSVHLCSLPPPHRFVRALAYNRHYLDKREYEDTRGATRTFPFLLIENAKPSNLGFARANLFLNGQPPCARTHRSPLHD